MVALADDAADLLLRLYEDLGDVPPRELLAGFAPAGRPLDDDALAEVIDADARIRLERGLAVELSRYIEAVPDLARRPVALDAAIEFSLRSLGDDGAQSATAVEAMVARYPMFAAAIRAASLLTQALWSTSQVRGDDEQPPELPADFGPLLPSGRPRYELRDLIGRGAQGSVYRATDRHLSDPTRPAWVAIKILKRQVPDGGRQRFLEEATRARRITHPNVVRVLDRGVSDAGRDYIVHEFIEGRTLRDWLHARADDLPARDAARLVAAIARGVQAAHSVGIVHCDLKPDNVLLTDAGEPKIADFGLAVGLEDEEARTPSREGPLGSLAFIAPEQYRMEPGAYSPAADIYACGGILYYLLTRRFPNGQTMEEIERHLDAEGRALPPDARSSRPGIDHDLAAICSRALSLRPDHGHRYPSAESLAADLDAWLRHEPLAWTNPGMSRRVRLFWRRQPVAVATLGLAFLAVAAASGFGVSMSLSAEQRVLAEKIEAERKQHEDRTRSFKHTQDSLSAFITAMRPKEANSAVGLNWLVFLTILENISGPELLASASGWDTLWAGRIELAARLADEPRREGRQADIESLLWQQVHGFFLLRQDRGDEAAAVLTANRQALAAVLDPTDPMLANLDAMLACAAVVRSRALTADERRRPDSRAELERTALTLAAHEPRFKGRRRGDTLHRLVIDRLAEAYGSEMLDRPEERKRINQRKLEIIEEQDQ